MMNEDSIRGELRRLAERRDSLREDLNQTLVDIRAQFVEAQSLGLSVTDICEQLGMNRQTAYELGYVTLRSNKQ